VADLEKELDALMLQTRYAKVIFICHSLGGIVARQYLLHVKNRYGHTALGRFRLVITLGTPMQGSALARLAVLASSNEQLRVLGPIRTNDYLHLLNHTVRDFAESTRPRGVRR
jgi:triacylglycerol esterase/lipase EstA (alpha/beta hydrolase family)